MPYHRISEPERLHAVIDAILTIEVDADLNHLLSTIVEQATGLVGARYGALGVLSDDGKSLSEFITVGWPPKSAPPSDGFRSVTASSAR